MVKKRREYIASITNENKRTLSVYSEWLVKTTAAKILNTQIESIEIDHINGKPFIKNFPLFVSISHSGNFVAAAFSENEIGIDIEVLRETNLAVAKKFCTNDDLEFLNCKETGKNERFFKIWTAKEAYLKITGDGIKGINNISYNQLKPIHFYKDGCIITIIKAEG
jgi:4'-phosphopantetheinyl transferase